MMTEKKSLQSIGNAKTVSIQGNMTAARFPTAFDAMAFDGQCREILQYMADCYRKLSSGRGSIEGERN